MLVAVSPALQSFRHCFVRGMKQYPFGDQIACGMHGCPGCKSDKLVMVTSDVHSATQDHRLISGF